MQIIKNAAGKWLIEVDDKEQIIRLYEELKAEEECSQCTQGCSSCDNVFKLAQNDEWIKLLEPIVKDVLNENRKER
ncbi:MAG: hypothetical protein J6R18_05655 [Kiritimatiellae bacterium]|nr:hypothetical protein [Kiritimatiellia bacterium]